MVRKRRNRFCQCSFPRVCKVTRKSSELLTVFLRDTTRGILSSSTHIPTQLNPSVFTPRPPLPPSSPCPSSCP